MNRPAKLLSVGALTQDTILGAGTLPAHQGKFDGDWAGNSVCLKCLRFGGRLGAPDRAETLAMMETYWPTG